ncbi:hypothetical protein BJX65DRAFT_263697 [Aspergillus insuetus]
MLQKRSAAVSVSLPVFTEPSLSNLLFPLQRPESAYHTIQYARSTDRTQIALQGILNDWCFETGLHTFNMADLLDCKDRSARQSHSGAPSAPPPMTIG